MDFWRIIEVIPEQRLKLLAEMKLPGEAILEFSLKPLEPGVVEVQQLSRFLPRGLGGILYWYSVYPLHSYVFGGMLAAFARRLGKTILSPPERFTPKLPQSCPIPVKK